MFDQKIMMVGNTQIYCDRFMRFKEEDLDKYSRFKCIRPVIEARTAFTSLLDNSVNNQELYVIDMGSVMQPHYDLYVKIPCPGSSP